MTIPDDRGVFLAETRRMHPDICRVHLRADLRRSADESIRRARIQDTEFGTGLRWLRAHHAELLHRVGGGGRARRHQIAELIGTTWTDTHGDAPR